MKIVGTTAKGTTVELTPQEAKAKGRPDALLDGGWNHQQALTRTRDLNQGLDPAFFRWLANQELVAVNTGATPNLIERLENLLAALEEAQNEITEERQTSGDSSNNLQAASARIEDAGGIAGEILTMIDGR